MSSLDEIVNIENDIHDMVKVVEEARVKLRQTDTEIRMHKLNIEGATAKITLHSGNVKHTQTTADLVDIKEFAETKRHLQNAKEALADAVSMKAECERRKVRHEGVIERATAKIESSRKKLSQYGQVRQFPSKEAAK